MSLTVLNRIKSAARIMLKGNATRTRRAPIPAITPKQVAEFRRFFKRDKFFIFGHARSGTTLLMRLVRLHREVYCSYQAHFFTRKPLLKSLVDTPEAEEWLTRRSNRWNLGNDLSPIVMRAAAEFMMEREPAAAGKRIVGDKSPSSTIHGQAVRDLHAIFPEVRLIYIVRDGRDVLISERFRNFVEQSRFLGPQDKKILERLRRSPGDFTTGTASLFTENMIRRVASGWAANVAEIDAEGRRLFGRHYLALRYEDLLANPLNEMRRVWKFLGVRRIANSLGARISEEMQSNPDEEWQSKRGEDLSSFLAKGRAGNWRTLMTPRDRSVFKEAAGEMLIAWEYEKSTQW